MPLLLSYSFNTPGLKPAYLCHFSPLYPAQGQSLRPPPASGLRLSPATCFSPHEASRPPLSELLLESHPPFKKGEENEARSGGKEENRHQREKHIKKR